MNTVRLKSLRYKTMKKSKIIGHLLLYGFIAFTVGYIIFVFKII